HRPLRQTEPGSEQLWLRVAGDDRIQVRIDSDDLERPIQRLLRWRRLREGLLRRVSRRRLSRRRLLRGRWRSRKTGGGESCGDASKKPTAILMRSHER